jgi:PIN domain nuclease of toxin-antitoxin system
MGSPSQPVYSSRDALALAIALKAPVYTTEQVWRRLKADLPIHVTR